ncbi:MAG: hypothetical protein LBJ13_02015 [Puniceicoccales bacterium]|jgi:hypothetical protein|nr:hypothetical protein [Puniceicoccales bacterium]
MNETEKKTAALISKESQETLDVIRKLIEESVEIPEDAKKKAFRELEKTKNKIEKMISKESGNHTSFSPTV